VQADTDDIQTRLPAALTAGGNMKTDTLYMNAAVWFDTGGAAGTTNYTHGTMTNPNSSMANSRTIANSLNLKNFYVNNNSTVTLDQGYIGFSFFGEKWILALANRLIDNSFFSGATVSGLSTGTGWTFEHCTIGTVTLNAPKPDVLWPPNGKAVSVVISGAVTDSESGVASAVLAVEDDYHQADRTLDITSSLNSADGSFRVNLSLIASRKNTDRDGREYRIVLTAQDKAGNQAEPVVVSVVCPRDQAHGKRLKGWSIHGWRLADHYCHARKPSRYGGR
jgi:hypothetical protein